MKVRHREEDSPGRYIGRVSTRQGDEVDVDEETGEYLLSTGYFEYVDDEGDEDDADICGAEQSDGSTCDRPADDCPYH